MNCVGDYIYFEVLQSITIHLPELYPGDIVKARIVAVGSGGQLLLPLKRKGSGNTNSGWDKDKVSNDVLRRLSPLELLALSGSDIEIKEFECF